MNDKRITILENEIFDIEMWYMGKMQLINKHTGEVIQSTGHYCKYANSLGYKYTNDLDILYGFKRIINKAITEIKKLN